MTAPKITAFVCSSLGISGTTQVFVREEPPGAFEARVGVAIMGLTNRKDDGLKDASPFDPDFNDNFAKGLGKTQEEALEALKKDMKNLSESLWL